MKKLVALFAVYAITFITCAEDMYIYSRDGITKGSGERTLPMQSVSLKTGKVVVGLWNRTPQQCAECGWYKVIPYQGEISSNQYFSCTGYVFHVEQGVVEKIGIVKSRKPVVEPQRITKYSKLSIYTAACEAGKWDLLNNWMTMTTISNVNLKVAWDNAAYLTDAHPLFKRVVKTAKGVCGFTDEQMNAFLKKCEDGYEEVK